MGEIMPICLYIKVSLKARACSKTHCFISSHYVPSVLLWLVKTWDKLWEFGAGDPSSEFPGGQFTRRPEDRGHFKHSALMATEAEGFASALHCICRHSPSTDYHCVMLPPSWADMLLEQHSLCTSNEAWIVLQGWMWGQSHFIIQDYCGSG